MSDQETNTVYSVSRDDVELNELSQPTPEEILAVRTAAGDTQTKAAQRVHATLRTWQSWESSRTSGRIMPLASWELYLIKTARLRAQVPATGDEST